MTKPLIVFADGCDREVFESLSRNEAVEVHPKTLLTPSELKTILPKASALVVRSSTKVDRTLIESAPNLRYVVRAGEATDNIDKALCAQKNIKVSNTPAANNNAAAEHAIALMLTVLRRIVEADASMRKGQWNRESFEGLELTNKTIGIMGLGRVGQIVARRLSGFDCNIIFFDPMVHGSQVTWAKKVSSLEELFSKSDIVTIHVPLSNATKGVVNAKLLSVMKPSAILVNAAGGQIVNEGDLYTALKSGRLRGAALDVFATEPLEADSKLRELSNIVLTPHLGGSTSEAQKRVGEMAAHQVVEFFTNNNLLNEVRV